MKALKLSSIIITLVLFFISGLSFSQTNFNIPGFFVYSDNSENANLDFLDLYGERGSFPAPAGEVELFDDKVFIGLDGNNDRYIDNIEIYDILP